MVTDISNTLWPGPLKLALTDFSRFGLPVSPRHADPVLIRPGPELQLRFPAIMWAASLLLAAVCDPGGPAVHDNLPGLPSQHARGFREPWENFLPLTLIVCLWPRPKWNNKKMMSFVLHCFYVNSNQCMLGYGLHQIKTTHIDNTRVNTKLSTFVTLSNTRRQDPMNTSRCCLDPICVSFKFTVTLLK